MDDLEILILIRKNGIIHFLSSAMEFKIVWSEEDENGTASKVIEATLLDDNDETIGNSSFIIGVQKTCNDGRMAFLPDANFIKVTATKGMKYRSASVTMFIQPASEEELSPLTWEEELVEA